MINQIRLVCFAWGGCFVGPSALTLGRRTLDVLLKILLLAAQNTRIDRSDRSAKAHSERTDPIAPKKEARSESTDLSDPRKMPTPTCDFYLRYLIFPQLRIAQLFKRVSLRHLTAQPEPLQVAMREMIGKV